MTDLREGGKAGRGQCELCGRDSVELTRHHLIPRMRHRNRNTQKKFSREQMTGQLLLVCYPCHRHIHGVLSEKQLANSYHSREALLAQEDIRRFVKWIAARPAGFRAKSRSMRRRG